MKIGIREINKIIKNLKTYSINELTHYLNVISIIQSDIRDYSWAHPMALKEGSAKYKFANKISLANKLLTNELTERLA